MEIKKWGLSSLRLTSSHENDISEMNDTENPCVWFVGVGGRSYNIENRRFERNCNQKITENEAQHVNFERGLPLRLFLQNRWDEVLNETEKNSYRYMGMWQISNFKPVKLEGKLCYMYCLTPWEKGNWTSDEAFEQCKNKVRDALNCSKRQKCRL